MSNLQKKNYILCLSIFLILCSIFFANSNFVLSYEKFGGKWGNANPLTFSYASSVSTKTKNATVSAATAWNMAYVPNVLIMHNNTNA
ncbi:hypothetical protein [Paenibacillus sp. 1001270B_150601_E10]|uniref:hypothetical protein n=1 Tax=Paenibacillus sp. 1001270B_150601_E10 TaxID=2787079 RepID=UPI0018A0EB0A|nr:hypothetical protein [Paenibacillus sp. 1001270B_150601_E10]